MAAESRWDWSIKYPVIRISFGSGVMQSKDQPIYLIGVEFSQKNCNIVGFEVEQV